MATTLQEDRSAYDTMIQKFGKKRGYRGGGGLEFAGNYWPPRQDAHGKAINIRLYADVETAFRETRRVTEAYIAAKSALSGANEKAAEKMTRWFGAHDDTDRDWWKGVIAVLGGIESFVVKNIKVYYRGDDSLIGQPNDYPGAVGNLVAYDFVGYAESQTDVRNNIVGLCEDFFEQTHHGAATVRVRGRDCVAGVLLHELSHNVCGTLDHVYSMQDALDLAANHPSKAWYNADNIEYFCEDIMYNI